MYLLDPIFKELSSIVDIKKLLNECNLPILLFCFENELDQNGIFSAEKRIHKKKQFSNQHVSSSSNNDPRKTNSVLTVHNRKCFSHVLPIFEYIDC